MLLSLVYGLTFEKFVKPMLAPHSITYGQQSGAMLVLSGFLGAIAGMSVALALKSSWWLAGMYSCLAACLGAGFVAYLWNSSLARHGPDTSDWILYVPPLVASLACCLLGFALIVVAVATSIRSRWNRAS